MTESVVETLIATIKDLESELSGFRGEMKEFKNSIKQRVAELEDSSRLCQKNPAVCANARRLEEHLKNHGGQFSKVFTVLGFCTACAGMVMSLVALCMRK